MVLYVGNVSFNLSSGDLGDIFSEFGKVVSANVITDRDSGRSKGFGFVEMGSKEEGRKAIQEMNGALVEGRNLRVNEAKPRD
ncbi:MAG: RNA recognition motif domain-containing protein [Bacteroidia bacterium]